MSDLAALGPGGAEPWLATCRAIVADVQVELDARPRREQRDRVVGLGEGGDRTVEIDAAAERVAVAQLGRLAAQGHSFTLVSEELGVRVFGDEGSTLRVVLDPIDGSLNAKRGLRAFALSLAVADGPTLADVALGFVHDFGSGEEWLALRGEGAWLDGRRLGDERPGERFQIVALEATRPVHLAAAAARMPADVERVRVLGSLALALCQVAAGRVDAVASLKPAGARSVDIAAAQLVVREAGFAVDLPDVDEPPLAAPLDLVGRSRIVAALDAERCGHMARLLGLRAVERPRLP